MTATDLIGLALLEGSKRTRERRHGGRVGVLSRGPPHDAHIRRRGSLAQRKDLNQRDGAQQQQRLATWAADPRTTIPQLRERPGRSAQERAKARMGCVFA